MPQYFRLDRPILRVYLLTYLGVACLGLVLGTGCRVAPGALVPVAAAPVSEAQVASWVLATAPPSSQLHRFKWLFQDERSSAGGRGSVRIAPPDSLRFDVAGPFGTGAASAVVVDNAPLWVDPPDAIQKLVPNYPLLWAMFGLARMPEDGVELRGLSKGAVTAWQYAGRTDTVEYVHTQGAPSRLVAEVRQAGKVIGRAETTLGPDGAPQKARLIVPGVPAKLDLTFLSTTRTAFAPDIWLRRNP